MPMCPRHLLSPSPVDAPHSESSQRNDPGSVVTAVTECYCHGGPGFTLGHTEAQQPSPRHVLWQRGSSPATGVPPLRGQESRSRRLAKAVPVTGSPTFPPSPRLIWDNWSELRGPSVGSFQATGICTLPCSLTNRSCLRWPRDLAGSASTPGSRGSGLQPHAAAGARVAVLGDVQRVLLK